MAKGFGIAALVVALLGIAVPIVTIFVIWLALVLAALAGFLGDKAFPIATVLTCLINLVFFSPLTWAALFGESLQGGSTLKVTTIILFITPLVALVIGAITRKPETKTTE